MASPDDEARAAAIEFAEDLQHFWEQRLGESLLGVYLIGSLAHDGFSRRYSDIDLGVVAEDGLKDGDIEAMKAEAAAISPELAPKLSLFWSDRAFSMGRFPPLDLMDYLDQPHILCERERVYPDRPTLDEVHVYLSGRPFTTWAGRAVAMAKLETLEPENRKSYLKTHLYPARFAYSWITGKMGSNDDAVAFVKAEPPDGLDVELITRALKCRHDAADPDMLFDARTSLPSQFEACARLFD